MKYNDPNYEKSNYENYNLIDLYYERINLLNNVYNYSAKSLGLLVDLIENKMLKHEKGLQLLVNMKIIAENRRKLEHYNYTNEERDYLFNKIIECNYSNEEILGFNKNALLTYEENICNNWKNGLNSIINFQKNILSYLKENLLLCGCNKSIS